MCIWGISGLTVMKIFRSFPVIMEHDADVDISFFNNMTEKPSEEPVKPIREQPVVENGEFQQTQPLLPAE